MDAKTWLDVRGRVDKELFKTFVEEGEGTVGSDCTLERVTDIDEDDDRFSTEPSCWRKLLYEVVSTREEIAALREREGAVEDEDTVLGSPVVLEEGDDVSAKSR